jgi:SAM-dependent methyltransferase
MEGILQRALKYIKIVSSFIFFLRCFKRPLYVLAAFATYRPSLKVCFRDGSNTTVSRQVLFHLFLLVYFFQVFPLSSRNGLILLSDGSSVSPAGAKPYLDMLVSKGWQVEQDTLRKGNLRFLLASDLSAIYEVFERKVYYVDVRDSTVVDVGAGTGDSCLYFAMLGAHKVIGVEPDPSRFALAKRNLHLNPDLASIIELKMGYVRSPGPSTVNESFTLSQLVASISHPLVLKMDCEGCEFDLILSDYESIKRFDVLVFEYHPNMVYKSFNRLLERLKYDYQINIVAGDAMIGIAKCIRKGGRG